ncbi:MAG: hypothetical protein D6818_11015 [Bacteroidetes bacterium]|nr:MAG: hypothetical protein D6818_11015 [Bacteroidota bacterium]
MSNTQYLTDTAWHKAWGCYVAEGGERHLTIGSFTPYEELTWELPPWSNGSQGAHVNIDDVWVMPLTRSGFAQLVRKELCEGQCVRFAHELEGEFSWFFEGGTPATSTLAQPEVCYDSAGTYGVGLVVQHCGGQDSFWFPDAVTVRPLPQPLAAPVTVLDVAWGDTVSLEPCVAADHYLWTSDNPIDCTDCPLPALTVLEPDTVWLTAWNGSQADGCTHTCAWVVQVGYPPAAVLSAERRHLCAGECTTFRYAGDEPVQSLEWFFPGGQPDRVTGVQEIEVCYDSAGTYDLGRVAGNAYGFDTLWLADYIQVAPRPWPVGPALQTLDVWEGDTLVLEPCLEGVAGQWRPAEGLSCTQCARPVVVAAESRRYVYEAGAGTACADSCIYELEVSPLEWKVYIPNVFSPNGDGANDLFTAQGPFVEVLELRVYDRWGDLLWRSNGQPWDGTLNGKPLNPGPYAWVMRLRHTRTGEVITRTGVVALVR